MIYIAMALYAEAAPLIDALGLKRRAGAGSWQEFADEERGICLFLTGVGKLEAAIAVSHFATKYAMGNDDFLVQLGSCAGRKIGQAYIIHRIDDADTERSYYPDILYAHSLPEAGVTTGSRMLQNGVENESLYDMEASGVYQAAVRFLGPHRMAFMKVVSDVGQADCMTPNLLSDCMKEQIPTVLELLSDIRSYLELEQQDLPDEEECQRRERLYRDMCCSETMRLQLQQWLEYLRLAGKPYWQQIDLDYENEILPCHDRKAGKQYFEQFKNRML